MTSKKNIFSRRDFLTTTAKGAVLVSTAGLYHSCKSRTKEIKLSKWVIENSNEDISVWRNTVLHEIAHGIDFIIRGTSKHDYRWRNIALAIGCDGERTASIKVESSTSKYTMECGSCGYSFASHKKRKREVSCGKCAPGYFNSEFIMEQIQNY